MKKLLSIALVVVLLAGIAVSGTMAYLQDSDSDVNVMTLGNVSIKQYEYERVVENGAYKVENGSYVLKDFTQGKPLYPAITDPSGNNGWGWDTTTVDMTQVDSNGSMKVFLEKNAQDKFVTVENTGKSNAYVRTLVAFEIGEAGDQLLGMSNHIAWTSKAIGIIKIDGVNYDVIELVYKGLKNEEENTWIHEGGVLPAGETTYPSLSQVYLKSAATNEDVEKLDGNKNGTFDILVLSQAVQAEGFADATTALNTAFGEANATNAAEWFGGMGNVEFVELSAEGNQINGEAAAEILETLKSGKNLIVDKKVDLIQLDAGASGVDANGATVTLNGTGPDAYGYLAFIPEAGKDTTVSNLNVTGSGFVEIGHYGMGGGNYVVNNLTIKDLASTLANGDKGFTLGCAFAHYGNATLNNCVMTGTTAVQAGVMPVDAGFVNGTTTVVNGGEFGTVYCWSNAVVTIDDADIDTLYTAPIKGTVTIKAGTKVGAINIDYGDKTSYATAANLAKLVIEDGATVGSILFNSNTYTVAEWNAYVATL